MFQKNKRFIYIYLSLLFILTTIIAIGFGAVSISPSEMYGALKGVLAGNHSMGLKENVFLQLRLPRVMLCAIGGASLALSGVLMQGVFRNPIVEPGLMGTSAGAALGASIVFVLSVNFSPELKGAIGPLLTPIMAFIGALISTFLVYVLSRKQNTVPVVSLLLVGMAVNALCMSGTGFMSYIARDPQARSITFWNLGTFNGANWFQVMITAIILVSCLFFLIRYAKQLNALMLGDEEALYLGVNIESFKKGMLILNTILVAVITSFVGVVGFIGLIVPHILRVTIGSDNKLLIPASAILGGIILIIADIASRLLVAPAEIPIGVITSLIGAPVFILLLRRSVLIDKF